MFVETLINGIMTRRTVPEIRKIAGVLTDLAALKMREKSNAGKAAALASNSSGGKNAPSLKSAKKGSSGRFDDCFAVEDDYDCFGE